MKTIYTEGSFGEPYRIIITDALLAETRKAQRALKHLPWNGEMFLPVDALHLDAEDGRVSHAEVCVSKQRVDLIVDGPDGRETMLTPSDNLLTISDVYLSIEFYFDLEKFIFILSEDDIRLIDGWKQLRDKNRYDSIEK